jgi:uncharacterized delta-60 repeat protein
MKLKHITTIALAASLQSIRLLAADGSYDTSWGSNGIELFDVGGGRSADSAKFAAMPNGKFLLAGECMDTQHTYWLCAASLLANGDFDSTFGPTSNGRVRLDTFPSFPTSVFGGVAALPDGRAVLVGYSAGGAIVAILKPDGTLDTNDGTLDTNVGSHKGWFVFNFDSAITPPVSSVTSVAVQPDGKIIVAGSALTNDSGNADFAVARLTSNLSGFDTSFGNGGVKIIGFDLGPGRADVPFAIALQPNGSIVLAGYAYKSDDLADGALVRLNSSGQIDTTFGSGGKVLQEWGNQTTIIDIALTHDGRIALGGYTIIFDKSRPVFTANRLLNDGSQDPTFQPCDGDFCRVGPAYLDFGGNDYANAMTVQSDGKILVAGITSGAIGQIAIARFREDGTPDPSFGDGAGRSVLSFGGSSSSAYDIAIAHGGIFVSGQGNLGTGSVPQFGMAKLQLDLIFPGNFDE